jgi:hypothetical protein
MIYHKQNSKKLSMIYHKQNSTKLSFLQAKICSSLPPLKQIDYLNKFAHLISFQYFITENNASLNNCAYVIFYCLGHIFIVYL